MTKEVKEVQSDGEFSITVDDVTYPLSALSDGVKSMIQMHQKWSAKYEESSSDAAMAQTAITQIASQIVETVRSENASEPSEVEKSA